MKAAVCMAIAIAVGCGGETSGETTQPSAESCTQFDGQRLDAGTEIECTCSNGATGITVCQDGNWSPCSCADGAGGATANPVCGNGKVEYGEVCDGTDLNEETCASATLYSMSYGTLRCTSSCLFDTSGCSSVGGAGGIGGTTGMGGVGGVAQ